MSDQELRDRNGHLLGKIKSSSSGKLELRGRNGHMLGTYDPKHNETRDRNGHLVAKGNMLTSLL